ncbi:hypothetical protein AKJ18_10810 [Vibrio xuii]|nr:hypothetical protein AKJ18_10810 [Vibrio xuii]
MGAVWLTSATLVGCDFDSHSSGGESSVVANPGNLGNGSSQEKVSFQSFSFKSDDYSLFIGDQLPAAELLVATQSDGEQRALTPSEIADISWDISDAKHYLTYDQENNTLTGIRESSQALIVSATFNDKMALTKINVIDDISNIHVSANSNTMYVGGSAELSVFGTTVNSHKSVDLTSNPNLIWTLSEHLVLDKNTMSISATKAGVATIDVSYKSNRVGLLENTQDVEIKPLTVSPTSSLIINPPVQTQVVAGTSLQLNSQLIDDGGQVVESEQINWRSNNTELATVTDQGVVKFEQGQSGIVVITASYGASVRSTRAAMLESSVTFTVKSKLISKVTTTASSKRVFAGQSISLQSLASYTDGTSADFSNTMTYHVSPSAQVDGNQVSFDSSTGIYTITPSMGGRSYPSVKIQVIEPSIETVSIDASLDSLMVGHKRNISAFAVMTDGSVADISDVVSWTVSNAGVFSVTQSEIVGLKAGTSQLTAVYDGVSSAPISIQVTDDPIRTLNFRQFYPKINEYFIVTAISLDDVSANSFEFDVTATYETVGLKDVDPRDIAFSWSPEENADISLSIAYLDNQRFSLNVEGSGKGILTASYQGISLPIVVEVDTSKSISSFDIAPNSTLHVKDSNVAYSAMAGFSDDTSLLINPSQIIWSSSNTNVATISPQGVASHEQAGSTVITGSYTHNGKTYTSSFNLTVLPYYVERLEFIDPEYWPEVAYVDEYLDIYESLYAVLSNGSKINLGFHDVTVHSKLGLADVFNTWAITVDGVGEEVITVNYEGKSLTLPPINVVESVSPIEMKCSVGYMVIDLWGASCWLQQDGRRVKASSFEFDHPDFAPDVSHIANSYLFNYVGDSSGEVPAGTALTVCNRDRNNCLTKHFDLVPINRVTDQRDDVTVFVKNGVSTTIPVVFGINARGYTSVTTIEYFPDFNMTLRDDKTLGRFIDNLFYAENEGESVVDVYLKWGKKDDQFIKSTRNLIVAEPTYEASSDTIEITGAFPVDGIPLPSLVTMTLENQDGSQSQLSDITSELVIDVATSGFEIVNNKLYFNGATLPGSVSFTVRSANINYLDVLDHITQVTLPINELESAEVE